MTTIDDQAMAVEPRAQPPVHRLCTTLAQWTILIAPTEARQTTAYARQCGSVGDVDYATHLDEQQV
jgi:hypothetical protein